MCWFLAAPHFLVGEYSSPFDGSFVSLVLIKSIFFLLLSTVKGTAKSPAVDVLRLNTLIGTKITLPAPIILCGRPSRDTARGCSKVESALNPSWLHCTTILYPTSMSGIMFTELNLNKIKSLPISQQKNCLGFPPASG